MGRLGFDKSKALVALCVLGLCVLESACHPSRRDTAPPARPPAPSAPAPSARWVFHPRGPQLISARTTVGSAEIVVDRGGSRWLVAPPGSPEPAPYGAPEALVAAAADQAGFAFVGESGAVYSADQALGPFVSVRRPPEVSFGAAVHEGVVLAVGQDGQLRRSPDLGRSWQAVPIDGFIVDVAVDRAGRALALSVPEEWFWSEDHGRTFRRVPARTIAPRELWGAGDAVQVTGFQGSYEFDGADFRPAKARAADTPTWTLPRGPSATEVRAGHAALESDFVSLVRQGADFVLFESELGGAQNERRVEGLEACRQVRLARSSEKLAVVCAGLAEPGVSVELVLWLGDVGSARFVRQPVRLRGDFDRLRVAVSPSGRVALSGICPAEQRDLGCLPRGVHQVEPGQAALEALPALFEEAPSALGFARTGELLAAGVREKDGHALLLVWAPGQAEVSHFVDLSSELDLSARAVTVELLASGAVPWGVLVLDAAGTTAAGLDRSGRPITSGRIPSGAVVVHGAGLRLAAVHLERGVLFESLDGGVTWAESTLPRSPCPGRGSECVPPLACSDAGCLLGDELTRVGWGREGSPARALGRTPRELAHPSSDRDDYTCHIASEASLSLPQLVEVPGAAEAALGDADFTAVGYDGETGALEFLWAPRGERRLERGAGFAPVKDAERYAIAVIPQVEGAAALRYRTPVRTTGDRMLSEIEVAWNNRLLGALGHRRLPSIVEGRPADYQPVSSGLGEAFPELLSVAGPGLYLALHRAGSGAQTTYYFEGQAILELGPERLPTGLADSDDLEYVLIQDEHVPLVFSADRSRVSLGGGSSEPGHALLLGEVPVGIARAQGVRLAYRGESIGVLSMMADLDGGYAAARFAELGPSPGRVLGDTVRVPLKPDLGPVPTPCSDAVRKATPRIVAPTFPGPTPRLRVLHGQEDVERFVLESAVLHGTPDAPCLAAWAGEPAPDGQRRGASGVLLLPSERGLLGWVFIERDALRRGAGYDAWPLACELAR